MPRYFAHRLWAYMHAGHPLIFHFGNECCAYLAECMWDGTAHLLYITACGHGEPTLLNEPLWNAEPILLTKCGMAQPLDA